MVMVPPFANAPVTVVLPPGETTAAFHKPPLLLTLPTQVPKLLMVPRLLATFPVQVAPAMFVQVELSGGIRDDDSLAAALATGCARVNLGTAALEAMTDRNAKWMLVHTEGILYVTVGDHSVSGAVTRHSLADATTNS